MADIQRPRDLFVIRQLQELDRSRRRRERPDAERVEKIGDGADDDR